MAAMSIRDYVAFHEGMNLREVAEHPVTFGLGVGLANAALALARDKPISFSASAIITGVTIASEMALAKDQTKRERGGVGLLHYGVLTGIGTFVGLAPFVDWESLERM